MPLKGMRNVMSNLQSQINREKAVTIQGLLAGGFIIEADAKKHTPHRLGFLKASGYSRRAIGDPNAVEVGFSQDYAAAVHEKSAMVLRGQKRRKPFPGVYWGPSGEAHFLRNAVSRNTKRVLNAIREYARVRKT